MKALNEHRVIRSIGEGERKRADEPPFVNIEFLLNEISAQDGKKRQRDSRCECTDRTATGLCEKRPSDTTGIDPVV